MDRRERYLKHGVHRVGGLSISLDKFGARYISSLDAIQETVGETGAVAEIGVHQGKLCIFSRFARGLEKGVWRSMCSKISISISTTPAAAIR